MTMPVTRLGPMCCVHACTKPVRELGGYCIQHWMGLSPAQRAHLQWVDIHEREGGDTVPIDTLELMYQLPSYGSEAA